ncbi:T9SS type A sorting domain-containing protein, partial [Xylanibacter muris]
PNPFVTSTDIKVNIPTSANTAMLNIYDLSGKQIKSIQVNERGEHSIYVTSESLAPGMYIYSLIIDGKLIDTKRMVVTQ